MTNTGPQDELPVLVIGAGVCGLAIAHGLQRANIPVIVFDRYPSIEARFSARDWAVGCQWSGPMLAKLVGEERWSRIHEVGVDPNLTVDEIRNFPMVKVLHGVTGEPLAEMRTDGEPFFRFLYSRLVTLLAEGIDVRYSKTLDRFSCYPKTEGSQAQESVTACFRDGTEYRGRLLIGADGSNSGVRSQLFQHEPKLADLKRLPYAATFISSSFTAAQARHLRAAQHHPLACAIPHPKGHMMMFCVLDAMQAEHPETWKFSFYLGTQCSIEEQDKNTTLSERLEEAKQIIQDSEIGDPIKSAFEWLEDHVDSIYYTKVANWDPSLPEHKWDNHNGLVTLAGDACHPMTYHRGQGLNHAVADAAKIVEILTRQGTQSQEERIQEYEAEMIERGGKEVRLSELNTRMLHDWEQLMNSPLVTQGLQVSAK
ncbi:hypothetical protein B0I35DRAFT_401547 [Stachybotrys elegans]|uniref:FAD-binding domain-containing protein n=1 Tax=Stachybotrys elegans TaxID=80388 RepID=A0A8K0WKM0_9HYPO|nr:hypothetical protein B0I35DRAFT_401547 [Stachybotrys elegans]